MSPRRAAALAARREIRERLRSRAFRASLLLQVAILVVIVAVSAANDGGAKRYDVAVAGPGSAAIAAAAGPGGEITVKPASSEAAARAQVEDQGADAAVAGNGLIAGPDTPDELLAALQAAARTRGVELRPPLAVERVGPAGSDEAKAIAYLGTLVLYIAMLTFGYTVAGGVVEEKSSRVVEVLLATIRPRPLLAGKVFGIGVVGLIQLAVIGGAGLIAASATGSLDLPSSTAGTLALVFACFLLGYAIYSSAFAAAGALVSRQEDLQSVTAPLLVILVGGYIAANSAIENASGTLAEVLTFVPPVAPLIVPARAARDALPAWELGLSLVLMALFAALLVVVAARVYERGVLRSGAPLKLTQGLRLARRG